MPGNIRNNYQQRTLPEADLHANPVVQFRKWLDEAIAEKVNEPTAMVLSTVDDRDRPHGRVVLLKDITDKGFVFFTNYGSDKGKQMAVNRYVSLTFFWAEMERQVRIDGSIRKVSRRISDKYFAGRPCGSRIGAWASPQSEVIDSGKVLTDNFNRYKAEFGENIPRPPYWGGYMVLPYRIEFWQGRPNRLHDRICYLADNRSWNRVRLAP